MYIHVLLGALSLPVAATGGQALPPAPPVPLSQSAFTLGAAAQDAPWVKVPEIVTPPAPPPAPGAVPRLGTEELYILDCQEPCFVLVSPPGIVNISQDTGPLKVRGRFVGGNGKYETRTFTGKVVVTVEAVGTGRVEILIVKEGAKSAADVFRQQIDANVGPMPPPPGPEPPKPPAPEDTLLQALQAAYRADTGTDKQANKARLAELFRQMAAGDVRNPTYATAEQLRQRLSAVATTLMQDALKQTRLACWRELVKVLPSETTSLDGKRDAVAAMFLLLAQTLEKVQ